MPASSNLEKMRSGAVYQANDPELISLRMQTRREVEKLNQIPAWDAPVRQTQLSLMLGHLGRASTVDSPFRCDLGRNIHIGDACLIDGDCTFQDLAEIRIGDRVSIGFGVKILTVTHPLKASERVIQGEEGQPESVQLMAQAQSVSIGDETRIGPGVIIFPGVSIGARTAIGAGSVVTRSIPDDCVAVGNPCRVIRSLA